MKEQKWIHEGLITESLPNGMFRVRLDNEDMILGHVSGKIRRSFIRKNTPELQSKLEELGYVLMYGHNIKGIHTWAELGIFFIPVSDDLPEIPIDKIENFDKLINCGDNEELFLAIAALRDDTDKNQWVTDGKNWEINPGIFDLMNPVTGVMYHKATVEELIEHFKK